MANPRPPANSTQLAPNVDSRPPMQEQAPTKQNLTSWWKQFKKNSRKEDEKAAAPAAPEIFGTPLAESINFANVAISLFDENGQSFTYGYVPIVVAKCGVYLKDQATDIEGIFRLAGAERRIKELQSIFNSPPRYGKGLDWAGYTVHDAANVLRRYFNTLPEPIIPLRFYQRFREPLKHHQDRATKEGNEDGNLPEDFDASKTIRIYQQLITELPPLNRQLLLYVLDLMAVFASKSDINRMPASNLAAIFQPGLISHPSHNMAPEEYRLSQVVLTFLIENQDNFLVGMQGTAADKETIQNIQEHGLTQPKPGSPGTPVAKAVGLGRSSSTASAGADSVRRYGAVRRNVSTSSKKSRTSQGSPSPVTPTVPTEGGGVVGVQRSNTVPSRKSASPAVTQGRFAKPSGQSPSPSQPSSLNPAAEETPKASATPTTPSLSAEEQRKVSNNSAMSEVSASAGTGSGRMSPHLRPVPDRSKFGQERKLELPAIIAQGSPVGTPSKERSFPSLFNRNSPSSETEKNQPRQPNRLRKKRPDNPALSAHSSSHSLGQLTPGPGPTLPEQDFPAPLDGSQFGSLGRSSEHIHSGAERSTSGEKGMERPEGVRAAQALTATETTQRDSSVTLTPGEQHLSQRPANSHATGHEAEAAVRGEETAGESDKRNRWRFSRDHARKDSQSAATQVSNQNTTSNQNLAASSTLVGSSLGAERSTSTVGSTGGGPGARRSFTSDSHQSHTSGDIDNIVVGSPPSGSDLHQERERRGIRGWIRGKLDDRKDRDAEKDRNKSPPPPRISSVSPVGSGRGENGGDSSQRRSTGFSSNHPALNPFSQPTGPSTDTSPTTYQNFGGRIVTPPKVSAESGLKPGSPPQAATVPQAIATNQAQDVPADTLTTTSSAPDADDVTPTRTPKTELEAVPTHTSAAPGELSGATQIKDLESNAVAGSATNNTTTTTTTVMQAQPEQTIRSVQPEPTEPEVVSATTEPSPVVTAQAAAAVALEDVAGRRSEDRHIPGAFE